MLRFQSLVAIFAFSTSFALAGGTDSDGDGLADLVETATGVFVDVSDTGTDPLDPDSDNDGVEDGEEVSIGTLPTDAASVPVQLLEDFEAAVDPATFALNGSAHRDATDNYLVLADDIDERGSGFFATPVEAQNLLVSFDYRLSEDSHGLPGGMAFAIVGADSAEGILGNGEMGLYGLAGRTLAIGFDSLAGTRDRIKAPHLELHNHLEIVPFFGPPIVFETAAPIRGGDNQFQHADIAIRSGRVTVTVTAPDGSSVVALDEQIPEFTSFTGFAGVTAEEALGLPGPDVLIDNFRVVSVSDLTLTDVAPHFGPSAGGTAITLRGTGFVDGATTLTIGGVAALDVTVVDESTLTATTPPNSSGAAAVQVSSGGFTQGLSDAYIYTSNVLDPDSDNDGVSDADEAAFGLDFLDPDSDDDGILDGDELALGSDPGDGGSLFPAVAGDVLLTGDELEVGLSGDGTVITSTRQGVSLLAPQQQEVLGALPSHELFALSFASGGPPEQWVNAPTSSADVAWRTYDTSDTDAAAVVALAEAGPLAIRQEMRLQRDESLVRCRIRFSHRGASPLTGLRYLRSVDPSIDGDAATTNDVLDEGIAVWAAGSQGTTLLMGILENSPPVVCSVEGGVVDDPNLVLDSPEDPDGATEDLALNLAFALGDLDPGEERHLEFVYAAAATPAEVGRVFWNSRDSDDDGIEDGVEYMLFTRGDVQGDGELNIADATFVINYLFAGGATPDCLDAADSNDDGRLNVADPISLLNYLFRAGSIPPAPGPSICGPDHSADRPQSGDLGCSSYSACDA